MDRSKKDEGKSIYRIPPYYYIHVLDQNSNVTKLVVGPQTFIRQDNEKVCVCVSVRLCVCLYTCMWCPMREEAIEPSLKGGVGAQVKLYSCLRTEVTQSPDHRL